MPYVDSTYYTANYYGEPIPALQFPRYEERAEEVVDLLTLGRIKEIGFSNLLPSVQDLVKKAVCAQIEYYEYSGIDVASTGNPANWTVGKVSVGGSSRGTDEKQKYSSAVCPMTVALLEQTGLMYRGIE